MRTGWLVVLSLTALLGGCAYTGENAAREELYRVETRLVRDLQLHSPYSDPAWMARRAVHNSHALDPSSGSPAFGLTVEPLGWYGTGWTATLEVRLRVDAAEHRSQGFNDRSYAAGSAERCLRISFGRSSRNNADEISCRGRVAKPIPPPKSVPSLDDGAPARLESALRADSFTAARQRATEAFSTFAVKAEIIDEVWAISVIAPGNDCIGGTRRPDGRIEVSRPPRVMREPGEGGCDPNWFVHPVRTH